MTKKNSRKKVFQKNIWDAKAGSQVLTVGDVSRYYQKNRFTPKPKEVLYNPESSSIDAIPSVNGQYDTTQDFNQTQMENSLDSKLESEVSGQNLNETGLQGYSASLDSQISEEYAPASQKPGFLRKAISGGIKKLSDVRIPGLPGTLAITLSSAALAVTLAACGGGTATPSPGYTSTPTIPTSTSAPARETPTPLETRVPIPTQTPTPVMFAGTTPTTSPYTPTPTFPPEPTPTQIPTPTSSPTATPLPTEIPTPSSTPPPTATDTPVPTATSIPTNTPYPTATDTPTPKPSVDPALADYSPLLIQAISDYNRADFVSGSLTSEEKKILDWADSRIFSNPEFLASKYSPNNWPSQVKNDSVRAFLELMKEIDVEKKSNGKHVINWGVDSLDRILDDLDVYKDMCTSCYGKSYNTAEEAHSTYEAIVNDLGHVHREMLKTFAYFAKTDGEGILIRNFMQNDADDFEMLYKRDPSPMAHKGQIYSKILTHTAFGWRNQSFMSLHKKSDDTFESFPTMVYGIAGDAKDAREAVERWFDYLNKNMTHFPGDHENFADIFRSKSRTPYTPESGYPILLRQAGSPSSTGYTTSASRLFGLKAEQFLSPNYGYRVGSIELDKNPEIYEGNSLGLDPYTENMPACALLRPTLDHVENFEFDTSCGK